MKILKGPWPDRERRECIAMKIERPVGIEPTGAYKISRIPGIWQFEQSSHPDEVGEDVDLAGGGDA